MQVNTPIANAIYTQAQNLISGKMIVNAFSGAGLLSAYLAKTAKKVYGIEIVESSHINAEKEKIGAIFYITPSNILETINIFNNVHKHF